VSAAGLARAGALTLSRRRFLLSAVATSAATKLAYAQVEPASADISRAPSTVLRIERRSLEVNGKPASVFGISQPGGTQGIVTHVGTQFRVRLENKIGEPSLIHWHGLTPPWPQDGVPGVSGPPFPAGGSAEYDFPLPFGGTFWMHSHEGLQEQLLMAFQSAGSASDRLGFQLQRQRVFHCRSELPAPSGQGSRRPSRRLSDRRVVSHQRALRRSALRQYRPFIGKPAIHRHSDGAARGFVRHPGNNALEDVVQGLADMAEQMRRDRATPIG
jgi:hypothetical protein